MMRTHINTGGLQKILGWQEASLERRRGRRFDLRMSCRLSPLSTKGVEFAGTVIDISRSGVLVGLDSARIAKVLKPDEAVRLLIDLPRHPSFSPRCLECAATVVRSIAGKAQTQVALEIGRMRVRDLSTKVISSRDWLSAPIQGSIQ